LIALRQWLKSVFVGHTYSKQAGTQDMNDLIGERVTVTHPIQRQPKPLLRPVSW
jgi:hypothetical protein